MEDRYITRRGTTITTTTTTTTTTKKRSRSKSIVRSRKKRRQQRWHQEQQQNNSTGGSYHYETTFVPQRTRTTFEDYVTTENFLPANEHGIFLRCLRTPLPVTFRIRNNETREEFNNLLSKKMKSSQSQMIRQVVAASSNDVVYQVSQEDYESNYELKRWLSVQTKWGHVSRQELVSMIPVWLLHIQSHHKILDMCASPGSKTIQAVDALYYNHNNDFCSKTHGNDKHGSDTIPTGFVIANEIDMKRSHVLAHRCKTTLRERQVSLAIVGHNATKFPNVLAPLSRNTTNGESSRNSSSQSPLYDRIICDVPCSGDGNQRRDSKVFKIWHPTYGIALHTLQLRIAKRAIALLKIGGRMTYSTCSFHPIENEAVVAALLATQTVELADPTPLLQKVAPQLVMRSGLSTWKVYNDDMKEIYTPIREIFDGETKKKKKYVHDDDVKLPSTLWPPPASNDDTSISRQLTKCIRMVPHDNDAGGFFIAVLKKIQDYPYPTQRMSATTETNTKGDNEKKNTKCTTLKKPRKNPLITPKASHHCLYPYATTITKRSQETTTASSNTTPTIIKDGTCVGYKRSETTTSRRVFAVSNGLARHICNEIGSKKLNIVYAGYDYKSDSSKKKKDLDGLN